MGKFTCPYCYKEHELKDCGMKCSYNLTWNSDCPGVRKDADGWIDPRSYNKCMRCTLAQKDVYCPDSEFDAIIPQRCIASTSLPIALIGAKATGKSNYIGVLVNEIKRRMSAGFQSSINMNCDANTRNMYNDNYYRPLYKEKMQIGATDSGKIDPLIFPVDFPNGKSVTLTFYDTAGENLDDEYIMLRNNGYLSNSKGIILLLDPLQVPEIREKLEGKVPLPEENTEAFDVLDRVVQNIENKTNNMKQFDIPLALVFTKMDALDAFDDILPEDSNLRNESDHVDRGAFVTSDFENTQIELRTLLENLLDGGGLEAKMRRFKKYAFFGISALGCMPDENGNLPQKVSPRRVLDPLLWILAENKYIKKVK